MLFVLKRLALSLLLIILASGVLLLSDLKRRKASPTEVRKIAVFQFATRPILDEGVKGCLESLRHNGFEDGHNLQIRFYNAENDLPTANSIAREIAGGDFEMVITVSTPCLQVMASANRDRKMTHIFGLVTDPFGAGVGINRENPLDHPHWLAGIGNFQPVREAIRLAREMNPNLKRIGVVWNPSEACSEACCVLARDECARLGMELVEAQVDTTAGIREAADSLVSRGVEALWLGGDNTVEMGVDQLILSAGRGGIPLFANTPGHSRIGALFGLGADYLEVGRRLGDLAAQILQGFDPAKVEIRNVMPEKLTLNSGVLEKLTDKSWAFPTEARKRAAEIYDHSGKRIDQKELPIPAAVKDSRTYRIGIVYFGPDPGTELGIQGLLDGFRDQGYEKDRNLEVLVSHAQGEIAQIPQILSNFEGQDLDLIIPMTTPCLTAALSGVKKTPIVFTVVYDPIAAGVGKSLEDHLPHVTGVGSFPPIEETMTFIKRLVPGVKTIGTLYNASEPNSRKVVEVARGILPGLDFSLEEVTIVSTSDIFQAAQVLATRGAQALWVTGDNTALQGFSGIVKAALESHLPFINNDIEFLNQGPLACVGLGFYEPGYEAARVAVRVLQGESPASIPMQNLVASRIGLNFDTARKLNLEIADEFIQEASLFVGIPSRLGHPARISLVGEGSDPLVLQAVDAGLNQCALVRDRDYNIIRYETPEGKEAEAFLVIGKDAIPESEKRPTEWFEGDSPAALTEAAKSAGVRLMRKLLCRAPFRNTPPVAAAMMGAKSSAPIQSGGLTKKWHVRLIKLVEEATADEVEQGFLAEAEKQGLVQGVDWDIDLRSAQGDLATALALIDDANSGKADLLVAITTPILQASLQKVKKIPIVFSGVADPVTAGAGESFETHLPNVTGVSTMSDFAGMIRIVKECVPQVKKIGTLYVPSEINSVVYRDVLAQEAGKAGMELVSVGIANSAEVSEGANSLCGKGIDAICQISDNTNNVGFSGIAQAARKEKKPLFSFVSHHVHSNGAAVALSRDYEQAGRDAFLMALRIMKGEKPAAIPFQLVSHTSLVVHPRNAQQCGFSIPQSVMDKASEVIGN